MYKWLLLILLLPSVALGFTGRWTESGGNYSLDIMIKKQFHYVNDKKIRLVGSRKGEVRVIGVRPKPLRPEQIEAMKLVFGVVPLDPITSIEEINGGWKIYYGEKERVLLLNEVLPVQSTGNPDTPPVVMVERYNNILTVETIHNSGAVAIETFQLIPEYGSIALLTSITVSSMKFVTPLVIERKYIPWSPEPEKSYVK